VVGGIGGILVPGGGLHIACRSFSDPFADGTAVRIYGIDGGSTPGLAA
jgi:hypothetical protein